MPIIGLCNSIQMPEYTVTSEIYEEYDYKTKITSSIQGSKYYFIIIII